MRRLNSWVAGGVVFLFVGTAIALAAPVHATSYTITVQTDISSYIGTAQIRTSGTVSPAPGPNTAVIVTIANPNDVIVDVQSDPVDPTTGSYNQTTVAGGMGSCNGPCWIAGTYHVNATWGGNGGSATGTTTFTYRPSTVATTTTVACVPNSFSTGATSQCTATVSGAAGTITGEMVQFGSSGTGNGAGNLKGPVPPTCTVAGTSCSIMVTGGKPGPITIQAIYPGDADNSFSSGSTNVTVLAATTTTSLSCAPSNVDVGGASTCTATVTGAAGSTAGEPITWFQLPGNGGTVTLPEPPTCGLDSGGSCSITVTGATPGSLTIRASYPGDVNNSASSGTASITALFEHSTVTSSTSSSSTSAAVSTSSSTSSGTSTSFAIGPTSHPSSAESAAYVIVAAVAVVVIASGVMVWRRKMASDYARGPR